MERIIRLLARLVRKSPWSVVFASLIITAVLGSFISQQETAQGNEGFAPDAPEWTASLTISERFSSNSETPMQVLFEAEAGDVLTSDGLQAYAAAVEAAVASEAAPYLSERSDGAIQGFFGPSDAKAEPGKIASTQSVDHALEPTVAAGAAMGPDP